MHLLTHTVAQTQTDAAAIFVFLLLFDCVFIFVSSAMPGSGQKRTSCKCRGSATATLEGKEEEGVATIFYCDNISSQTLCNFTLSDNRISRDFYKQFAKLLTFLQSPQSDFLPTFCNEKNCISLRKYFCFCYQVIKLLTHQRTRPLFFQQMGSYNWVINLGCELSLLCISNHKANSIGYQPDLVRNLEICGCDSRLAIIDSRCEITVRVKSIKRKLKGISSEQRSLRYGILASSDMELK